MTNTTHLVIASVPFPIPAFFVCTLVGYGGILFAGHSFSLGQCREISAMAVTTKQFVARWSEEMERADRYGCESYWEAEDAVKELRDKYPRRFRTHSLPRVILKDLVREAKVYEHLRTEVAESNRAFKSALSLLASLRLKARKQATTMKQKPGPAFRLISRSLVDISKEIERCSRRLKETRSEFWRKELRTYPGKWDNPQEVWIALPQSATEWDLPHEESYTGAVAEGVERSSRLPNPKPDPKRTIDLDGRFQLRVAGMFEEEFPDLSMETRARLVVLVYVCFDLVKASEGELGIRPDSAKLTVGAVYEKLKRQKRRQRIKS
jgi:hypothetical protein